MKYFKGCLGDNDLPDIDPTRYAGAVWTTVHES